MDFHDKKEKTTKILLIVLCGIVATAITAVAIVFATGMMEEDPPKPQITYGEFPFTLVYEMNGETIMVEDSLVIEYKGVGWNEAVGKHNKWERYLKSQQDKGYIKQNVILFHGFLENGNSATIYFELGSCEYYMGLKEDRSYYYYSNIKPGDIVILTHEYNGSVNAEDLYEKYKIKLVKKEISSPIAEKETTT